MLIKEYHKGITLLFNESKKHKQWIVSVSKALFGKRSRAGFSTRALAEKQIKVYENKLTNRQRSPLDPEVHKVVALYADKLSAFQIQTMLEEGVKRYGGSGKPLQDIVDEYQANQKMLLERGSLGQSHFDTVKCVSNKVTEYLGNPILRDVQLKDLDEMVNSRLKTVNSKGKAVSPRTVFNEISILIAVFNFAIKNKYIIDNPCLDVSLPSYKPEVHICKPEELINLLEHSCHYIQCWIMFGAFGGLRSSEIYRMSWDDVRLSEGQFYIEGSKNESAERWIKMTPPLMDFCKQVLESDNPPSGLIMSGMSAQTRQRYVERAYKKAGYRIPKNGLRHSYGSHHLVYYQNADNTANEMGHIGPQMTFRAYRKAVLKSQAAEYFGITCEAKPWVKIAGFGIKKNRKSEKQKIAA